jgi:hypothetical protein
MNECGILEVVGAEANNVMDVTVLLQSKRQVQLARMVRNSPDLEQRWWIYTIEDQLTSAAAGGCGSVVYIQPLFGKIMIIMLMEHLMLMLLEMVLAG